MPILPMVNLMQIFELSDMQYLQNKTKLIEHRSFEEGK